MARKSGNGSRDVSNITNQRLRTFTVTRYQPRIMVSPYLRLIEDRRLWHPDALTQMRPVRMLNSQRPRLKPVAFSSPKYKFANIIPTQVGFEIPKKVAICVRRKQRKEVLFAKNKTGRGNKRPKRNQWSDVHC